MTILARAVVWCVAHPRAGCAHDVGRSILRNGGEIDFAKNDRTHIRSRGKGREDGANGVAEARIGADDADRAALHQLLQNSGNWSTGL